jgi:esterase/lipase superfamily enzyme
MRRLSLFVLLSAPLLAGCASDRTGDLVPVAATAPGTHTVDLLVATTRAPTSLEMDLFTGERARQPSFARIGVSIPPDAARKVGEVQWPARVPGNPATDFVTTYAERLDRAQAVSWLGKAAGRVPEHRVLVFVHGFNNRFDDAVFRFAQIVHDSGAPVVPVLFTWPSRGSVFAYGYDRESTNYSRDALEDLLQALSRDPAVGEISILAHSMGNWLALEALRQMAIRDGRVSPRIRNVMLAAPDVDVDVFRRQFAVLGNERPNVTLFVSQDDRALAVSRRVWGGVARLGAVNPESDPYKDEFRTDRITVLDLTRLRTGDDLNHGKFAESPEVVRLIGQRLVEGQTITDQRVGLGERLAQVTQGAAGTIGAVAGAAVSAPIAIVDPATRRSLGEQVDAVGAGMSSAAQGATSVLTAPIDAIAPPR